MDNDAWDDRKRVQEEEYFSRLNKDLISKMGKKIVRNSPVSGELMQSIELQGLHVQRCTKSGGIWIEKEELQALYQQVKKDLGAFGGVLQLLFDATIEKR
jgi:hypothetical protein